MNGLKNLEILASAISDVGYWSWWTSDLPKLFQIEFGGTQLILDHTDKTKPPSTQIAIQFQLPKSISFLSFEDINFPLEDNWPELLQNDELEPPGCSYESFSFTDDEMIMKIIQEADSIKTIHGYSPHDDSFLKEAHKLAFWAGNVGFVIASEKIKLLTINGKIDLDSIPFINQQWWDYWLEYWKMKDSKNPMPKDYACEITIPTEKFKI